LLFARSEKPGKHKWFTDSIKLHLAELVKKPCLEHAFFIIKETFKIQNDNVNPILHAVWKFFIG